MYDSFTSTSISSEFMSTSVAMPVRVNPPPAEMGDTTSPRCASLETTMPSNGARTIQLSASSLATPMRGAYLLFGQRDLGVQALRRGFSRIKRLWADHASIVQALGTHCFTVCIGRLNFKISQRGGSGVAV